MKKLFGGLIVGLCVLSSASADTHTDKTFLMPRDHMANLALENTTYHKQVNKIDDSKFGAALQASLFYQASTNDEDLGKYFGITNRNASNRIDDYLFVAPSATERHLNNHDLFLDGANNYPVATTRLADKIVFRPHSESYGVRLDWHQKLDKLIEGLYFKVNMPIVCVKTSLGYSSTGGAVSQPLLTDRASTDLYGATTYSVIDYLTGNVANTITEATQVALSHYKIHNGQSETGIADINFVLGYNFLYKEEKHIGLNMILTIPTGNTADGIYRFEPIVGNGGHWAIGLGADAAFEIWKDTDKSLDISMAINYRYLFEDTEKRTVDFKWANTTDFGTDANQTAMWGPYMLGGRRGDTFATPLANFLTQDLEVTPGSQLDAMVMLTFNCKNWTFDLGYELFWKEEESVDLKSTWSENYYGTADRSWDTTKAFITGTTADYETIYRGASANAYTAAYDLNAVTIDQAHLLVNHAATPSQLTHKLFGGIGYAFNKWEYPLLIGTGGSYEFASDNSALENWSVWFKVGIRV